MLRLNKMLLAALFALLVLGAGGSATDPTPVYNTDSLALVFDDSYSTATPPVVITRIDAEVYAEPGTTVTQSWAFAPGQWTVAPGVIRVPLRTQAVALANGLSKLRVRVLDTAGNISGWSEYLYVNKAWRTIPTPSGCRTVAQ